MWNVWPQTQWVPSVQKNATNSMARVRMGCAIWERKDLEDLDKDGALVMPWLWPIILHVCATHFQTRGRMICKTCCLESSWAQSSCQEKARVHFTFYFSESLQTKSWRNIEWLQMARTSVTAGLRGSGKLNQCRKNKVQKLLSSRFSDVFCSFLVFFWLVAEFAE